MNPETKAENVKSEVKQEATEETAPAQDVAADGIKHVESAAEAAIKVETTAPETPSNDEIRSRLLKMLEESDLSQVTEKMLRKQLEEQLGVKLADRKQLIREEVLAFLAKQQADQEAEDEQQQDEPEEQEEGEEEKPQKKRGWGAMKCVLSEPLAALVGAAEMSRSDVVKALWDYIKANNLQNPKDRRQIILDDKLRTVFNTPLTMFSMNKQLTKHIFNKGEVLNAGSGSDTDSPKLKSRRKPTKMQKAGSDESDGDDSNDPDASEDEKPKRKKARQTKAAANGEKKVSGFAAPQKISDELAAATGQSEMSRGAVVKWLFAYAKENNLLDPSNKRYVLADETLKNLTGESRFLAFGASKLLSKHFLKK